MRTSILFILILLSSEYSKGQVAIIQDSDGWTNVRKEPNPKAKVIHQINETEVFWYNNTDTKSDEWVTVYIPMNKFSLGESESKYLVGFIHKSRLVPLAELVEYKSTDFSITYKLSPFDSTGHIINRQSGKWITDIDGRHAWGTDGNVPKVQIDNIIVKILGKEILINKVFYNDLYECDNHLSIYRFGDIFIAYQRNGDGAGSYEIVWVLDKNGLRQRLVGSMI